MPIIDANGSKLHYETTGTGPDLVMIHGLAANLAFWQLRLVPLLSNRFRVTTYDLRGHGYSSMPSHGYTTQNMACDLRALLDHLEVRRANLVGHSFGGAVALHFALLFPERVKTITLADARLQALQPLFQRDGHDWDGWRRRIQQMGIEVPDNMPRVIYSLVEDIAREKNNGHERQLVPFLASSGLWAPHKRSGKQWRQLVLSTSALTDWADPAGLTESTLSQIRKPVLAMYGQYSHCMLTLSKLVLLLEWCTKLIVPRAGHYHPLVRPVFFVKHLVRFLTWNNQPR